MKLWLRFWYWFGGGKSRALHDELVMRIDRINANTNEIYKKLLR